MLTTQPAKWFVFTTLLLLSYRMLPTSTTRSLHKLIWNYVTDIFRTWRHFLLINNVSKSSVSWSFNLNIPILNRYLFCLAFLPHLRFSLLLHAYFLYSVTIHHLLILRTLPVCLLPWISFIFFRIPINCFCAVPCLLISHLSALLLIYFLTFLFFSLFNLILKMTLPLRIPFLFLPVRLSSLSDSFTDSLINSIHQPISYFLSSAFPSPFVSLWCHISHTRTRQWTQTQITISSTYSELKV